MKKIQLPVLVAAVLALTLGLVLADPVIVKKKAKDLRDKVQGGATNQPPAKTNAPAKR